MTPPERDQVSQEKGKVAWERPTLTVLGDVRELIQAAGKDGSLPDGDPASMRKRFLA